MLPTESPRVESKVISVVPLVKPAVQLRTLLVGTLPDHTSDGPRMHTLACRPPQGSGAVNFTTVRSGPTPRRVTLLLPRKVIPVTRV